MEYIKFLTLFIGIITVIITIMFTTRTTHFIVWGVKNKISNKVNKALMEYQRSEYENDRRAELYKRINDLQMQVWELENKNNKKKGSK